MRFMPEPYVLQSFEALLNIVVTSTLDTFLKDSWMPSSIDQNSVSVFDSTSKKLDLIPSLKRGI